MSQTQDKSSLFPRQIMGIGALLLALVLAAAGNAVMAQTQTQTGASSNTPADTASNDAMTPNEILALFEREARAGYALNKQACDELTGEDKKRCLAAARLQFDADMRYAQKRAAQGY